MSPFRATAVAACCLALVLGRVAASPARAEGPADPLLRLVPPDAGLTVVVEDLRTHARAFLDSPLSQRLAALPAVKAWKGSEQGRALERAKGQISAILQAEFASVRDGLLGEAFVLTLRNPPDGHPDDARGLLLTRVVDRALLDRTVAVLNDAQTKKGELLRVSERKQGGASYYARQFQPGMKVDEYYAHLDGRVFAWSNSEELIRGVLDRQARGSGGLDARPDFATVARRLPGKALVKVFADPVFLGRLVAPSPRPSKPADEDRVAALLGRYVGAVRYAGAAVTWRAGEGFVVQTHEAVDPHALDPALTRWASRTDHPDPALLRVPPTALALAQVHVDFGALFRAFTALFPESEAAQRDNLVLALKGILLGLDPVAEVAPRLGPGALAYVERPDPSAKPAQWPVVIAAEVARGTDGGGIAPALDNALRTFLAFYALDPKHHGKLRVETRAVPGGDVTTLTPRTPLAYAVAGGRLLLANSPEAVVRALAVGSDPSSGAWYERLRAAYFPGVESFACADLGSIHAFVDPRRADLARQIAARQGRAEADVARDLDQALALIHLFDAAFLTSAIEPAFTGVHRTFGLVALPRPSGDAAPR